MEELDSKRCIIHYSVCKEDDEHLISPQNYDSWISLLEAAKIRNNATILDIAANLEGNEIPKITYHRKCRSLFTMKRDLETIKRKSNAVSFQEENESSISSSTKKVRRSSLDSSFRLYDPICIFCNRVKYLKNTRTREKLTQAVQLRADDRLRECAINREDERIIAITSRDIVAAEAHYHASCYKLYTVKIRDSECHETDEDAIYKIIEREAYKELFVYIRSEIIPYKKIVPVTFLANKLESLMSCNVEFMNDSTKKHIRRNLELELGNAVDIFPDGKGKLLVVPDNLTVKDVVLENQTLHQELKTLRAKSSNVIDKSSLQIRSVIRKDI